MICSFKIYIVEAILCKNERINQIYNGHVEHLTYLILKHHCFLDMLVTYNVQSHIPPPQGLVFIVLLCMLIEVIMLHINKLFSTFTIK